METKNIIGLFSQIAGGKDTVANYLVKKLNNEGDGPYIHDFGVGPPKWKRVGFADAVKKVLMDSFNVTWDWIEEWKRKDEIPPGFDLTIRKSLQQIGDGFRKIQKDVWIRIALRKGNRAVISDGRYLNEARMIREHGGFNVLLWRPGFENNDPNPSEAEIKPLIEFAAQNFMDGPLMYETIVDGPPGIEYFDYFLINDGPLEDLYRSIDSKLIPNLTERGLK